jgi:hypothetical protein
MDDDLITYPESREREGAMRLALRWLGEHFDPAGSHPAQHELAVRHALGLKPDEPLRARTIASVPAARLHQVFGEIVQIAIAYDNLGSPDTAETILAAKAYSLCPPGVTWTTQPDRALEVAFGVVAYFLASLPGGLIEATSDMAVETDFDGFLGGLT